MILCGKIETDILTGLRSQVTPIIALYICPVKKMAVFASGSGSNAQKIIDYFQDSDKASVALVVSNKEDAGVVTIAANHQVPVLIITKERFLNGDAYLEELNAAHIDMVVLAGFLWKLPPALIKAYPGRILNIHPALLPKYGGKGMYGKHVHQAVLANQEKESGITIHIADEHYDQGDVVFQVRCPVLEDDTAESLAQRVQQLEHIHYPQVIGQFVDKMGE
jgi:phosphoribosylglycinamide formyltransferase-1